jgi:alpha-beta hydrolase superfamily lysophospholipase
MYWQLIQRACLRMFHVCVCVGVGPWLHWSACTRGQRVHHKRTAGERTCLLHSTSPAAVAAAVAAGESMGGAVAILAAHRGAFPFDGVLLRAPMCGVHPGLVPSKCVVSMLKCLSTCCPAAPIIPGYELSRHMG